MNQDLLIHQRANFPSDLNLLPSTPGGSSARAAQEGSSPAIQLEDIESFGIAGRTWHAAYRLLDYLFPLQTLPSHPPSSQTQIYHHHHPPDDEKILPPPPAAVAPGRKPPPHPPILQFNPPSPIISSSRSSSRRRMTILDLGSGTGHLPIQLTQRLTRSISSLEESSNNIESIRLIATDLPAVVPLLERNVLDYHSKTKITSHDDDDEKQYRSSRIELIVQPLSWGHTDQIHHLIRSFIYNSPRSLTVHEDHLDTSSSSNTNIKTHHRHHQLIITCSDLIFFPFLFAPLIHTLLILTSPDYQDLDPIILIGYKERSATKEYPFFSLIGRYFRIEPILSRLTSSKDDDRWELIGPNDRLRTDASDHRPDDDDDNEKEVEDRLDRIYLLRLTRLESTRDLDLSFLTHNEHEADHHHHRHLDRHGDPSGIDQWEWILLSQLNDDDNR